VVAGDGVTAGGEQFAVRRLASPRTDRDAGSSVVELVLLTPALILFVFTIVQVALWFHAKQVVTAAAQEGARVARQETATATGANGRTAALAYVTKVGGQSVVSPTAVVDRTALSVTVTVRGNSAHIVPGLTLSVSGTSHAAVERFRAAP
jgi:Flp pilus assembly protein TadG